MSSADPYIVAVGAALSANKGAASMLQAVVDNLDEIVPEGRVVSLSTYPSQDREQNRNARLQIVSLTPLQMLFPVLPLALLIWLVRRFGRSGRVFALTHSIRVLMDAKVVADLAGISFSDGRGFPTLVYNVLTTGLPLLVGARVVKCSQAIGPCRRLPTRIAARTILPRCEKVVARGPETRGYLEELDLANVVEGADLGFLMRVDTAQEAEARRILAGITGDYIVASPSSVVKALCETQGIDYIKLMVDTINCLIDETGLPIVILAHSARPGHPESRMNDIPVCEEVSNRLEGRAETLLVVDSLDPATLREIIGGSNALIASRFHAMISGIVTHTPTVVVGWSHKYAEVMAEFGLEGYVLPYRELKSARVAQLVLELLNDEKAIREQIALGLGSVIESSRVSLEALKDAAHG